MSVTLFQFVTPSPAHIGFVPSAAQLTAIASLLAKEWINPISEIEVMDLENQDPYETTGIDDLAASVTRCLAERGSVFVMCPGPPAPEGLSRTELERDYSLDGSKDLVVYGRFGIEVRLLLANQLCTIVGDMGGTDIPCPVCRGDIMWEREDEPSKALNPYFPAPMECPHCGAALDHQSLIAKTRSGAKTIEERAPFYQFALMLWPAGNPQFDGTPTVDPALLDGLGRICGVEFRSVNRWG